MLSGITIRVWQVLCIVLATLLVIAGLAAWLQSAKAGRLEAAATAANTKAAETEKRLIQEALDQRTELQANANKAGEVLATSEKERALDNEAFQERIKAATTGRACLGGRAVALLNERVRHSNASSGSAKSAETSGPGNPPGEDAAEVATDTNIASWAASAQDLYSKCTGRLSAWQVWYTDLPQTLK